MTGNAKRIGGMEKSSGRNSSSSGDDFVNVCRKPINQVIAKGDFNSKADLVTLLQKAVADSDQIQSSFRKYSNQTLAKSALMSFLNDKKDLVRRLGRFTDEDLNLILGLQEKVIEPKIKTEVASAERPSELQELHHQPKIPYYSGPSCQINSEAEFRELLAQQGSNDQFFIAEKPGANGEPSSFSLVPLNMANHRHFIGSTLHAVPTVKSGYEGGSSFSNVNSNPEITDSILKNLGLDFSTYSSEYIDGNLTRGMSLQPGKEYLVVCIRNSTEIEHPDLGEIWNNGKALKARREAGLRATDFGFGEASSRPINFEAKKRHFVFVEVSELAEKLRKQASTMPNLYYHGPKILWSENHLLKDMVGFTFYSSTFKQQVTLLKTGPEFNIFIDKSNNLIWSKGDNLESMSAKNDRDQILKHLGYDSFDPARDTEIDADIYGHASVLYKGNLSTDPRALYDLILIDDKVTGRAAEVILKDQHFDGPIPLQMTDDYLNHKGQLMFTDVYNPSADPKFIGVVGMRVVLKRKDTVK